ncbi:MAG: CHAD domain-containing protein [Phycisphaerales bacterium]|nr:CHAD domain-containing protein [Phycisphaerales bacterium]
MPDATLQTGQSPAAERRGETPIIRALVRLRALLKQARRGEAAEDLAHRLRTSARRGEAALRAATNGADPRDIRRARRLFRRVREAAGPIRECDVHLRMLGEYLERTPADMQKAGRYAQERLQAERDESQHLAVAVARRYRRRPLRRVMNPFLALPPPEPAEWSRLLKQASDRSPVPAPDADIVDLHRLRRRLKQLRYMLELAAPHPEPGAPAARLAELQDALGGVRDAHELAERLARYAADAPDAVAPGLSRLGQRFGLVRDARLREARAALCSPTGALARVRAAVDALARAVPLSNAGAATAPEPVPRPRLSVSGRLAAIDVGTNSIRLMVAEARGPAAYRVLDDEKEMTRLGSGLGRTGAISDASLARTVDAVDRFRRIAEGYRVDALRIVGTSACREASNTADLAASIRARTGIDLEVISEEEEGRLAFQSAAHSFDLRDLSAAVIDIGGGSTEVVLSTAGAIERMHSLRLGALRTTERHGGPRRARGREYEVMRRHVSKTIRRGLKKPGITPQLVIGTGGTFTTLAAILRHRRFGPGGPSLWDRAIPGHEIKRSELRHVLDWLRSLPESDLARVPGLPPERADIIVAGLTIAERLLKRLGANAVHVHDRGIRDGIVLGLAARLFEGEADGPDPITVVRRFAEACRYEAAHSEHVTRLALSIHDQLAAALGTDEPWTAAPARRLLEAAGVLHDIGYLVNYSGHHRHGYHLIVHSDLSGLTRRELEIVANLALYHRRAEPSVEHPNFASLSAPDRDLVRRLAAILRIADGLDRTHTQQVQTVSLSLSGATVRLLACADADVSTDLWGAQRKSGLFRKAFDLGMAFDSARDAITRG